MLLTEGTNLHTRVTFCGGKEIFRVFWVGFTFPHNQHKQDEPPPPYPQHLCPLLPWQNLPWYQNHGSAIPHESFKGTRWRVCDRCCWFLCLGHQNLTHQEIEKWVGPRPQVAANHLKNATTNQKTVSLVVGLTKCTLCWIVLFKLNTFFSHFFVCSWY